MKVIYEGCFFDTLPVKANLERKIEFPHITFQFKPTSPATHLVGEKALFEVDGYANDGKNEGLSVKLISGSKELEEAFELIPTPHITISVSADGKPVETGKLSFEPSAYDGLKLEGEFKLFPFK